MEGGINNRTPHEAHCHRSAIIISITTAVLLLSFRVLGSLSKFRERADSTPFQACNVLLHGAVGHGVDDTKILQRILDDESCAEVIFPSGNTFFASELSVRRNHVTLTLEPNATLAGLPTEFRTQRPDCASEAGLEFAWTNWCALLRVTAQLNFSLRGAGTIEPGGVGGASPDFYSAMHISSTSHVALSGVRVTCSAWWWCMVFHNASDVSISRVFIDGAMGRDGIDLVNCRRVLIEDSVIEGSDDALCFKTIKNDGLGAWPSFNVLVRNTTISSTWCNAIQFGSATEVNLTNFTFRDVRIRSARKAAVSLTSMDGGTIANVSFENLNIRGRDIASPFFIKVGNRANCEDGKGTCWRPGAIRDVSFLNVSASGWGNARRPKPGHSRSYTATIEGLNSSYRVGPILFHNLMLVAPGGGGTADADIDPPISALQYAPRFDGVRPAYGLFVRHAHDVTLSATTVGIAPGDLDVKDGRPAIVVDDVERMLTRDVRVVDGLAPCQLRVRNSSGDWTEGSHLHSCAWAPKTAT